MGVVGGSWYVAQAVGSDASSDFRMPRIKKIQIA